MSKRKTLQELTIKDNFMFAAVMLQEENCRDFWELTLGFPIARVEASREMGERYMLFEELLSEERAEGRREGERKGLVLGKVEAILELLEELGPIPEELAARIQSETDVKQLSILLKAAASVVSLEQFMKAFPQK